MDPSLGLVGVARSGHRGKGVPSAQVPGTSPNQAFCLGSDVNTQDPFHLATMSPRVRLSGRDRRDEGSTEELPPDYKAEEA